MKVAVSYISSKYDLEKTIELIDNSNADFIHVDLMDGIYVDNKNFEIDDVVKLLSNRTKPLDVHLMVDKPEQYLIKLSTLNVTTINIHPKTTSDINLLIDVIKSLNIKVGIAINPDEDLNVFQELFPLIDQVLIMSVVPGKGGQTFIEEVIPKIKELVSLKEKYNFLVAVDGGINDKTINNVKEVDIVISGSYICKSDDYNAAIESLK